MKGVPRTWMILGLSRKRNSIYSDRSADAILLRYERCWCLISSRSMHMIGSGT
jgi:hypothetical protein